MELGRGTVPPSCSLTAGPSRLSLSPTKAAEPHSCMLGDALGASLLLAAPSPSLKPPEHHPGVHQHPRAQQTGSHAWGHGAVTPPSPSCISSCATPYAEAAIFPGT